MGGAHGQYMCNPTPLVRKVKATDVLLGHNVFFWNNQGWSNDLKESRSMGLEPEQILVYLENHPMTCKWLITMVIGKSPKDRVGLVVNGRASWLIDGG